MKGLLWHNELKIEACSSITCAWTTRNYTSWMLMETKWSWSILTYILEIISNSISKFKRQCLLNRLILTMQLQILEDFYFYFETQEAFDHLASFPSSREMILWPGIKPPTTWVTFPLTSDCLGSSWTILEGFFSWWLMLLYFLVWTK